MSLKPPLSAPTPEVIARFAEIVGPAHALTDRDRQQPYLHEWRDRYVGRTPVVLRPGTTDEVARILEIASENRIGVVPQAGNTGLVGGQIPDASGDQIVLSVERLQKIRDVDAAGFSMTVEAGLTLDAVKAVAENAGRLFPLSMASSGSSRIGGNLATNAGGLDVIAYGSARHLVLGLEVVLADGRIWNGLRALKKDNTGYDLRDLFIGSEGTLGVITAATLKLVARPAETVTAFVPMSDLHGLTALFRLADDVAGPDLTAFEFLPRIGLELVTRHIAGARSPVPLAADWYALIEISGRQSDGGALARMAQLIDRAGNSAGGAVLAASQAQTEAIWKLREAMSEAQKCEGDSIKHDVSVPVPKLETFIRRANQRVSEMAPGARPIAFGHFGDGNVHYNIMQPAGLARGVFLDRSAPISDAVHRIVADMGGSIAAEHGIGAMKRSALTWFKSEVELDLMRRIKAALDPNGILNPGKLL